MVGLEVTDPQVLWNQQERKATAPLAWGDLPAIREDRRKDMVKEYHALKLRNSLDPKRFYKGQGSIKHVPEVFAVRSFSSSSFESWVRLRFVNFFFFLFIIQNRLERSILNRKYSNRPPSAQKRTTDRAQSLKSSWSTTSLKRTRRGSLEISRRPGVITDERRSLRSLEGIRPLLVHIYLAAFLSCFMEHSGIFFFFYFFATRVVLAVSLSVLENVLLYLH